MLLQPPPCRWMLLVALRPLPLRSWPPLRPPHWRAERRRPCPSLRRLLLRRAAVHAAAPSARRSRTAWPAWPATLVQKIGPFNFTAEVLASLPLRGPPAAPGAAGADEPRAAHWTSQCCALPLRPGRRLSTFQDASVVSWLAARSARWRSEVGADAAVHDRHTEFVRRRAETASVHGGATPRICPNTLLTDRA